MKKSEKLFAQFGIFILVGFAIFALYNKEKTRARKSDKV